MAPSLLFDISKINLEDIAFDTCDIESVNPHRGNMRLLDKIVYYDSSDDVCNKALAYKDINDDEFWVAGHIPGRPIFPGVLMIEAAAQLSSFLCLKRMEGQHFMGFAGLEDVKFRGQVTPGDRLYILCAQKELRRRRSICKTQAVINGTLVYEGTVIGMPM